PAPAPSPRPHDHHETGGEPLKDLRGPALVFPNNAVQPLWPSSVNHPFRNVCQRAEIGSDWHLHEQRHTFVSVLSDSGVDIDVIADAAGHINSNVTKVVYRHQIADKISKAATVMDQIFGEATGS
ncbi:MAG: tyrosine-type recombinase/integrase, partial [Streptosporangiaceae bacterium]